MDEESWKRNHRGVMEEESWRRNHGEGIMEEESWEKESWEKDSWEEPLEHSGKHPRGTQRHSGHPSGSRRSSAQKLIPLSAKMQHFY